MTHSEKVELLVRDLERRGISPYDTAPPIFRWLWARGIEIPPPAFVPFWALFIFTGSFFVVGMFLLMAAIFGLHGLVVMAVARLSSSPVPFVGLGFVAKLGLALGACGGIVMTVHYRLRAWRFHLSDWKSYGEAAPRD